MGGESLKTCNIIMSCYNEKPEWLMACIDSLKKQEKTKGYKYNLLIGVDYCKETADLFDREKIPYYYPAENVGLFVMINSMIKDNPADIYALFDSDDIAYPDYLQNVIPMVEKYGFTRAAFTPCDSNMKPIDAPRPLAGRIAVSDIIYQHLGGFYPYRAYCDTDFAHRASKLLQIPLADMEKYDKPLYLRRLHEASNTAPGKYGVGGAYYKEIKYKLRAEANRGNLKIEPVTVELEYHA